MSSDSPETKIVSGKFIDACVRVEIWTKSLRTGQNRNWRIIVTVKTKLSGLTAWNGSPSPYDSSIWKDVKQFKNNFSQIPPIKNIDSTYACINEEKVDAIASHLELQFPINNVSNPNKENDINLLVRSFLNTLIIPTFVKCPGWCHTQKQLVQET